VTRARALVLALVVAAAACRPAAPRDPGQIVLAIGSSPTSLDPGVGLDETSQRIQSLVFSPLVTIGDDLRIVPDLATRFETADSQTYVAALPAGVHFHDGRELTSADVVYTFRRFLDPAFVSARKGAYQDLQSVDALDRYTVAFRLRAASAAFPANVANVGIVPEGSGATIARHPVGTGPYRLVDFVPDDHVTLAAFGGWFRGAPKNAGITFKVVPDATMRGLELRKGDVDLVVNDLTPDLVHELEAHAGVSVTTAPGTDFAYIGLNLRDPTLADRRVRQAIGYAVDRQAIVRYLQRGQARETAGLIPSMSWAYTDDLFRFTHDLARSAALLDEAGYRDPDGAGPRPRLHLVLKTSTAEAYRVQATALQQQLAGAGIELEIRSFEFATLFSDVIRGNVQLYTLIFTGGSVADPDILRRVFHSSQMPPNGFNRAHYVNPEVDRLLDLATASLSEAERRRHYLEAERVIALDAPMIPLWARSNVAVAQADLAGITLSPIGDFAFLPAVHRR
jgi:peptide/nickel transport system substrate-binding protein